MAKLPSTMPKQNIIAMSTLNLNTYKVTFKVNGTTVKTADVKYTFPISYPSQSEIASYIPSGKAFNGWDSNLEAMPKNDITINAILEQNEYTISYYKRMEYCKDGVSDYTMQEIVTTQKYNVGATITPPALPTEDGYTAGDWETT